MASRGGGQLGRVWRRFNRRSLRARMTIVAVTIVVIAGIGYGVSTASNSPAGVGTPVPPADVTALNQASTSSVGVTKSTITVAFPIANLTALAQISDSEETSSTASRRKR